MDYSSSIDALAFAGKLTVETSGLNRDNKEGDPQKGAGKSADVLSERITVTQS